MSEQKQTPEDQLPASTETNKPKHSPQTQPVQKRKRHVTALTAAAQYRGPVSAVSAHSYSNSAIESTGINIEFKETGGID